MNPPKKRFTFFKGRVALHAILKAANIGHTDSVLLPGYTCVVVPNAIIYSGAKPVYVDIDPTNFNLDPNLLEDTLKKSPNGRHKAVIVQHTYGIPCDMDSICQIAERYNLLIIEDSCHAIASLYKGQPVGSFGHAAFYSSQWSKPVTTGLGGWAVINNPELAENMAAVYSSYNPPSPVESQILNLQYHAFKLFYRPRLFWMIQGIYRKLGSLGLAIGSSTSSELACEEPVDYMKSMGRLQKDQLTKLLRTIDRSTEERRRHTIIIENKLADAGFSTVPHTPEIDPVILRYPILVNNKDVVLGKAKQHRVQLGDWYLSPVHPNLNNWDLAGYIKGTCPNAELISNKIINISTDNKTSESEITRTVNFLKKYAEPYSIKKQVKAQSH